MNGMWIFSFVLCVWPKQVNIDWIATIQHLFVCYCYRTQHRKLLIFFKHKILCIYKTKYFAEPPLFVFSIFPFSFGPCFSSYTFSANERDLNKKKRQCLPPIGPLKHSSCLNWNFFSLLVCALTLANHQHMIWYNHISCVCHKYHLNSFWECFRPFNFVHVFFDKVFPFVFC